MRLYAGDDLHSNNNVLALMDEKGATVYRKRLPNKLDVILRELEPYRKQLTGIAVESTFNWYWFVDGLMEAGYRLHLANPAAMQQYTGLKHTDDHSDATWLAEMLRLKILPEGYIYPLALRSLRDLLRKRGQLVRYRTAQILSIQNQWQRNTGSSLSCRVVKSLTPDQVESGIDDPDRVMGILANVTMLECFSEQIEALEKTILARGKKMPEFKALQTVPGIGKILGLTIALETGNLKRFPAVGNYTSYCRCVTSQKMSNGKRKGQGNKKNGNRYLAWAFGEAAHFAIRFNPGIRRYYQRKAARTKVMVALKAVAHKLARASYYVMKDQVPFEVAKSFG
jgi:transposase